MPDKANSPNINLIKERQISLPDKFLDWSLTAGRFIVIATEIIALSAFIYRFSLDRQLIDLHQIIKQEQVVISNLSERENAYRNLQERIAIAKGTNDLGNKEIKTFTDILNSASSDVIFNSLSITNNFAKMDIEISNISSLTNLVSALKENPDITSVSIDRIENRPSGGVIAISITAGLKPEQNKYETIQQ